MEKIFQDAKDKNVAAIKVFTKTGETKAYLDSATTKQFAADELKEAYVKGAEIVVGTSLYKPVSMDVASSTGVVTLTYVTANTTTATTAVLATVESTATE